MKRFGLPVVVTLLIFTVNSFGQSLAEIAKRERERQKTAKSKVVVTSNEPAAGASVPAKIPPSAPATTQAEPSAAAKPTGPTDNKGHDETYWRALFQSARDDAKRAQDRAVVLDLRVKDLNTQLLRQSDVYNRENRIGPEIAAAQKDLDDARREAAAAQQKITDLEDELRKSGGPAGWSR